MLKSRKLSIVVLAVFFLSVFTGFGAQPASAATYPTDIAGNWASAQISSLINQGVIGGNPDGTFKPNNSISRAEYFTMINRAFNFTVPASITYSDVKTSDWFYLDIAKARGAGYVAGYPDGTIKPNNNVSREEAAVILAQALGLSASASGLSFSDAAQIQSWSWSAISSVVGAGYMAGYPDGSFKPANSISRAEAAAMVFAGKSRVLVTGVNLNKSSTTLGIGKSETLLATVSPSNAANKNVNWFSSNPSVATVSSSGSVYGKDEGTATITVTTADRGKTATCVVTVKDVVEVTGVTLDESSITLETDDTVTLDATVKPSDATNQKLIWTSSDEDVATVSSSGKVTAQDEGTCTIKVRTEDGGYYDTCKVKVEDDSNGSSSGSVDLNDDPDDADSVNIDMDIDDTATVKVYLPGNYTGEDVGYIDLSSIDGDEEIIYDVDYEDYDDNDEYIVITIMSDDYEGDATIYVEIEVDDEPYYAEVNVNVEEDSSGSSSGSVDLSDDEDDQDSVYIEMDTDDEATVYVYLADDYTCEYVEDIDLEATDNDNVIYDVEDEDYDADDEYIVFTITSDDNEGNAILYFTIYVDGEPYYAKVYVTVND